MERKIPKNVRQIGNVSDSLKIYVEDYVDTYLNQLCEKEAEKAAGAVLVGEMVRQDDLEYLYVYGAVQMDGLTQSADELSVSDETWKKASDVCEAFFENGEIVGWFAAIPGIPFALNANLKNIHKKLFGREKGIFVLKDPVCKDEMYFAPKFGDLTQMNGHYIYYEKNPAMQNYMISSRRQIGVTPSEVVVDRAAKSFRDLVQSKMLQQERTEINKWAYGGGLFLTLVILVIGVTTINNYDRMRSVQSAIESMSGSLDGRKNVQAKEPAVRTAGEAGKKPENQQAEETDEEQETHEYDNGFYIVEKGDTLEKISMKAYGDMKHVGAISRMNGLKNGDLIYIGQKLLLP